MLGCKDKITNRKFDGWEHWIINSKIDSLLDRLSKSRLDWFTVIDTFFDIKDNDSMSARPSKIDSIT